VWQITLALKPTPRSSQLRLDLFMELGRVALGWIIRDEEIVPIQLILRKGEKAIHQRAGGLVGLHS